MGSLIRYACRRSYWLCSRKLQTHVENQRQQCKGLLREWNSCSGVRGFSDNSPEELGTGRDGMSEALREAQAKCIQLLTKKNVSGDELESCLKAAEEAFPANDPRVGVLYLRLGQMVDLDGGNADQVMRCGEKGLHIYEENSLEYAMCLHLVASALYKKKKFENCLEKLDQCSEIIENVENDSNALKFATKFLKGDALAAMGKQDEAIKNYLTGLSIQENLIEGGNPQLGDNYRRVAEALAQVVRLPEAIEYCEKALQVHQKHYGEKSVAEAADRRVLAVVYKGMNEFGKALEQHKLVREILVKTEKSDEARLVDIGIAECLIRMKQYDEAIVTLKNILSTAETESTMMGLAHVHLSKVYFIKEETNEALDQVEKAMMIMNKMKGDYDKGDYSSKIMIAEALTELASVCESMEDYETAVELLKEVLNLYEAMPGHHNVVAGTMSQIGMCLHFLKKSEIAVTYMDRAAKMLQKCFGDEHPTLGCVLNQMGVANLELKNFVLAVEQFEKAKKIFIKNHGPGHEDTLAIYHNLVVVYSSLCRYDKAIKNQEEVIKQLREKKGSSEMIKEEEETMLDLFHKRDTQSL